MDTRILCYARCSTCKKALKWMDEKGYKYESRPIDTENPSAAEIKKWHEASALPLKRFFNTSGMIYREMGLKDKLKDMSQEEQYDLLGSDGMLVKRPLLVVENDGAIKAYPGFREKEWTEILD